MFKLTLTIAFFVLFYGVIGLAFASLITWSNLFLIGISEWSSAGRSAFLMYLILVIIATYSWI